MAELSPPVTEADPQEVKAWLDAGTAVLIDVREPNETAAERIAEAKLLPLSSFDPSQVEAKPGQKVVFQCAMGGRSARAAAASAAAGVKNAVNLRGGIRAWKAAGLPTIS